MLTADYRMKIAERTYTIETLTSGTYNGIPIPGNGPAHCYENPKQNKIPIQPKRNEKISTLEK